MHEEGEVEGGGREVAGEEQGVDGLAHARRPRRSGRPGSGPRAFCRIWAMGFGHGVVVARRAQEPRRPEEGGGVGSRGRRLAGQGLEEDGAQAEDVRPRVAGAARLLGGQVAPLVLAGAARPARTRLGQYPKPRTPDLALEGHEHAVGGEEPVKDAGPRVGAAGVGVLERGAHLAGDEERVVHRERVALLAAAIEDLLQRPPFDELVGDVVARLDLPDAEDLGDVRVLELGGELHLVHQAARGFGVARRCRAADGGG